MAAPLSALEGELGQRLATTDGSGKFASEMSITVDDPRLNNGRWTNIPLLVFGQKDVDKLLAGEHWTPEQQEIAILRAWARVNGGHAELPSHDSLKDAKTAAGLRSDMKGEKAAFEDRVRMGIMQ